MDKFMICITSTGLLLAALNGSVAGVIALLGIYYLYKVQ